MRIQEFDIVKGIAISCVVFAHAIFFNFDKFNTISQNSIMIISSFFAPAIAIFFFISGFLGYNSYMKRKKISTFEIAKLKVILPPYLTWSTIYIILQGMFGQIVGVPYSFSAISMAKKYLFGEAFLPFYYIIVLILFYLLTPMLSKPEEKKMKILVGILFITGLISVCVYFLPQYFGKEYITPLIAYRNPFAWIFFYAWGMYTAKTKNIFWRKKPLMWMWIGFFATYALSSLEMITVPKLNRDWESYLVLGPGIYVFYFFAINVFLWLSYETSKFKTMSILPLELGKNSFGIYLSHGFILIGMLGVFILLNRDLLTHPNMLLNIVGGLLGIFICYEFSVLLRKIPRLVNQILI